MKGPKYLEDMKQAKKIMDEIIAEKGPPESEDEAAKIFKQAWEQLGYTVVDDRA